jgi:hypothetical protein
MIAAGAPTPNTFAPVRVRTQKWKLEGQAPARSRFTALIEVSPAAPLRASARLR